MSAIELDATSKVAGKIVHSRTYLHISALLETDPEFQQQVHQAIELANIASSEFNVVRHDSADQSIALLQYPTFFESAFPELLETWKVRLADKLVTHRTYADSLNPPILHRKELLLRPNDRRRYEFENLTATLESLGLFDDPVRIGFRFQWTRLLAEKGYKVVGHALVPQGNEENFALDESTDGIVEIARHRTALSRSNFSAPVQLLNRFGYLDGTYTVFDYGCGKGDDLKGLLANGISATGWDPYYAPDSPIVPADVVNIGFVINVIEDPLERRDALQRAFSLAGTLLVVAAMIASEESIKGRAFADGVLTGRDTFQKYYSQTELREYIGESLNEIAISVAPGVFFVFRDKGAEQRFELGKLRGRIRKPTIARPPKVPSPPRVKTVKQPRPDKYEIQREALDELWRCCIDLGRQPDRIEVENIEAIESSFGSLRKALTLVLNRNDNQELEISAKQRTNELLVFFALQLFQKRQPYRQLDPRLQRDIKSFFGDYGSAVEQGRQLLYQIANPDVLNSACEFAAEHGLGFLEPNSSLQLHSSLVPRLPAVLRVYVGCASGIYGDVSQADLIKLHIRSSKVSFMRFDDFDGLALPKMIERTKVNLRSQSMDQYEYNDTFTPPYLFLKSRFLNEEYPFYSAQTAFDEQLLSLGLFDFSGYGPGRSEFEDALRNVRKKAIGYQFVRDHYVPSLDSLCGQNLTYRQLIECGDTQRKFAVPNMPANPETYTALYDLATKILDPTIEYFGRIELTYGFCSAQLAKMIKQRVAPRLDQHACHEIKGGHVPICDRLGAAVDFLIRDENMREVAEWITKNLPYDRLYYYGPDRPIHISFGPEHKRDAVEMIATKNGRLIPRPFFHSSQ